MSDDVPVANPPDRAREASGARLWLAAIAIGSTALFLGSDIFELLGAEETPRATGLFLAIPSIGACWLAWRHRAAVRSDPDVRGQFSVISWGFGVVCALLFVGTVPKWDSPVWALSAVAGGVSWYLVRADKRRKKGRARG